MKLSDMKLPKKTKKEIEAYGRPVMADNQDRWPYGLQLRFETEQVEKLPVLKTFKVGDKVTVLAEATVTEVRMSEIQATRDKKTKMHHTVELQVEQIGCTSKEVKPIKQLSPKEYRRLREDGY